MRASLKRMLAHAASLSLEYDRRCRDRSASHQPAEMCRLLEARIEHGQYDPISPCAWPAWRNTALANAKSKQDPEGYLHILIALTRFGQSIVSHSPEAAQFIVGDVSNLVDKASGLKNLPAYPRLLESLARLGRISSPSREQNS